ncbi:MAG TPA: MFS transporter [Polyangia bacterium]|nr:MFS transporter [Polyangia bacterium]
MSQGEQNDGTATALPVTLEIYLDGTPANEVRPTAVAHRPGPLGLPRPYWVLWGGMLLNCLGGTVFFLLGVYLTRERGLSTELSGLIISAYAAGGLLAGPVGGVLADRLGRRATLLLGTATAGTLMLALGGARSTAGIVVLAPLLGFFTALCRPPLLAAVADVVPPEDRPRAYGLLHWAINLGFAGAAVFGGALADHHFILLFLIDGLTTFGYGAIVLACLSETRPAAAANGGMPAARRHLLGSLLAPLSDRRLVRFVLIQLLLFTAFTQVIVTLPLDMRAHGLGMGAIGRLLAFNGIGIVVLQPIALRTLGRFSRVGWLAAGALFVGLGCGVTAFASGTPLYVAGILLWTLGEIGFATGSPAIIAELAPTEQRGAYQGTYQLAWGAASTLAPALGALVLARLGSGALWLGGLGLCLLAAGLHLRFTGQPPAR